MAMSPMDIVLRDAIFESQGKYMPEFDSIRYTNHAIMRMNQRKIARTDVELVLRMGENWADEDGIWICEMGHVRVVVREDDGTGREITAIRLKGGAR